MHSIYYSKAGNIPDGEVEYLEILSNFEVIHISAFWGHSQCVLACLEDGIDPDIYSTDSQWNPLIIASGTGQPDTVELLLQFDANVNVLNRVGQNALLFAVTADDLDCVRLLLIYGIDVNHKTTEGDVRRTALMTAVYKGHVECMKLLLEFGAKFKLFEEDPDHEWDRFTMNDVHDTFPPSIWEEIIMLIIKEEESLSYGLCGTALRMKDNGVLLRRLLEMDIQMKSSTGEMNRLSEMADWLFVNLTHSDDMIKNLEVAFEYKERYQLDVESKLYGLTALQWACTRRGKPQIVKVLLANGADPDVVQEYWGSSLFLCISAMTESKSSLEAAIWLIKYNCNMNITKEALMNDEKTLIQTNAMDFALSGLNLYAAQVLLLAGLQNCHPLFSKIRHPNESSLLPTTLRCTKAERDSFIQNHLRTPISLYNMCRVSVRNALGKYADDKIHSLGVSQKVEDFLRFTDLTRIAQRFKEAYENMRLTEPEP